MRHRSLQGRAARTSKTDKFDNNVTLRHIRHMWVGSARYLIKEEKQDTGTSGKMAILDSVLGTQHTHGVTL